jgi:hypothetical protein
VGTSYEDAGVNISAGETAVERIKSKVRSTFRPEVIGDIGGFGALFALDIAKYRQPVLVSSTDGVGTKALIAQATGRFDTIGIDLVAMCVDDIVCQGAEPLFFLDYIAVGQLDPDHIEQLVEGVAHCFQCHSDHDVTKVDLPIKDGMKGAGWQMEQAPGLGTIVAPNITPDKATGIGDWTDDEIARAVREGIRRDGRALFPIMQYRNYRHMSDEDIASIVVYLRSIPPIKNALGRLQAPFPVNRLVLSEPQPVTEPVQPDLSTPLARGTYLATLASCGSCHTPAVQGQVRNDLAYAGGNVMAGARDGKTLASLNITPDISGISYFDESIFMTIIRNGKYGARELRPPMPWAIYRNMTDDDLKAVWTFLHDLTPVSHRVDNSMEPTMCPVCGNVHGAGEKNKKK